MQWFNNAIMQYYVKLLLMYLYTNAYVTIDTPDYLYIK